MFHDNRPLSPYLSGENITILCHKKQLQLVHLVKTSKIMFKLFVHRGSYMSANILLNLLKELRKREEMRGLPSIYSLFRNSFNKFNNIGARMLDSIYGMTLE